jgi:hypothetical protein
MKEKLGIVIVSKSINLEHTIARWRKVQRSVEAMNDLYPDPKIIIAANIRDHALHQPPADCKKIEMVTRQTWVRQDMIVEALKKMKDYEIQHCMILSAGFVLTDISKIEENKFTLATNTHESHSIHHKKLDGNFMYGKTQTLLRLWENRPFDKTISLESNIYKNVKNLFGEQGMIDSEKINIESYNNLMIRKVLV